MNHLSNIYDNGQKTLLEKTTNFIDIINLPWRWIQNTKKEIILLANIHQEYNLLKKKLLELQKCQANNTVLKQENLQIRHFKTALEQRGYQNIVLTRIVLHNPQPLSDQFIVEANSQHNIKPGYVAIDQNGVIGRVTQANAHYSTIMPLTHPRSKIPVIISNSGKNRHAIVTGTGHRTGRLDFLTNSTKLQIGHTITALKSQSFLGQDLPIGYISKITPDDIQVTFYADIVQPNYIAILIPEKHEGTI